MCTASLSRVFRNAFGGVVHAVAAPSPTLLRARHPLQRQRSQSAAIAAQTAQIAAALGTPTPQARQQIAQTMSQALKTSDPNQQMQLYDQVVRIDPNNAAAIQGYKEAAAKVGSTAGGPTTTDQAQQQEVTESERDHQVSASLSSAQSSFLSGDMKQADASLRIAERLTPSNPLVNDLRSRINIALGLRRRLVFLVALPASSLYSAQVASSGGHVARFASCLHIVHGLDQGRVYPVDRDTVRIGGSLRMGAEKRYCHPRCRTYDLPFPLRGP